MDLPGDAKGDPRRGDLDETGLLADDRNAWRRARLDTAELVDVVGQPAPAPELPVCDRLQADILLHPHRLSDRIVLARAQLLGRDAARLELLTAAKQLRGAQQATDVVGPEGWGHARSHVIGVTQKLLAASTMFSSLAVRTGMSREWCRPNPHDIEIQRRSSPTTRAQSAARSLIFFTGSIQ